MLRAASAVVLAVLSIWIFSEPAFAEKRVALVMGNSAYQKVPPLANPARDAGAMSEMFKNAGFDVVQSRHDLGSSGDRNTQAWPLLLAAGSRLGRSSSMCEGELAANF
jgi:hypothetical protein